MIRSMTAFGRARMTTEERDVTVEIKSVNSRYLDCSVKMPRRYSFLEEKVKAYIQQNGVSRGKVDVYISVDTLSEADTEILVDEGYARGYISALECLRDLFGLQDDISVMQVARDRDVFTFRRAEDNPERDWDVLKEALDGALRGFLGAREAEGRRIEPGYPVENRRDSPAGGADRRPVADRNHFLPRETDGKNKAAFRRQQYGCRPRDGS